MRSDTVKQWSTRSAHRSLFNALGIGKDELKKPLIGVVNSFNELIPGHMHLREIADAAKLWSGKPAEFLWSFRRSEFATVSPWDMME